MEDGATKGASAGDAFGIPPGDDGEVTGNEPCVQVDFSEFAAGVYQAQAAQERLRARKAPQTCRAADRPVFGI
jgi:hypothetical protein